MKEISLDCLRPLATPHKIPLSFIGNIIECNKLLQDHYEKIPEIYTVDEVAKALRLHPYTIRRL